MRKFVLFLFFCSFVSFGFAAAFNSKDGGFSISLPPKWQNAKTDNGEVLNLKNGESTISVTPLKKCNTLDCLQQTANTKIKQLKNKKIKLIKNTYSGEEIKKREFSTLDPYLYFSYVIDGINYTEGYFLADSKGYKIEFSDLSYTDADLYLSFIAPKPKEIQDLPLITEEEPLIEENISAPEIQETERQTISETLASKKDLPQEKSKKITFPRKTAILISVIFAYIFAGLGFYAYNLVFPPKEDKTPTNPKSFYPIRGTRLYGSPDLFLKLYDSQGHNFIITTQRWSSFLQGYGLYGALFFALMHFIIKSITIKGLDFSILVNTSMSICCLFMALSLILMLAGKILDILFPAPILIYTDKGTLLFKIVRRSKGFWRYSYLVLTNAYTVAFRLETQKIFFKRKWFLFDKDGQIAIIYEKSFLKALARKLLGHLGGTLRTNYLVEGKNESKGEILSQRRISAKFKIDIDKPQAVASPAMLSAAAVIFTKGRDRFYPWFN